MFIIRYPCTSSLYYTHVLKNTTSNSVELVSSINRVLAEKRATVQTSPCSARVVYVAPHAALRAPPPSLNPSFSCKLVSLDVAPQFSGVGVGFARSRTFS